LPHILQVLTGESPAHFTREILGDPVEQILAVFCPLCAALLKFDDASSDFPLRRRHERIHGAGGSATGRFEQIADASHEARVMGRNRGTWLLGFGFRAHTSR
jgi:hypothetical protein